MKLKIRWCLRCYAANVFLYPNPSRKSTQVFHGAPSFSQSVSSNICEEKRVAVAVAVAVTAETETETETVTTNAFMRCVTLAPPSTAYYT